MWNAKTSDYLSDIETDEFAVEDKHVLEMDDFDNVEGDPSLEDLIVVDEVHEAETTDDGVNKSTARRSPRPHASSHRRETRGWLSKLDFQRKTVPPVRPRHPRPEDRQSWSFVRGRIPPYSRRPHPSVSSRSEVRSREQPTIEHHSRLSYEEWKRKTHSERAKISYEEWKTQPAARQWQFARSLEGSEKQMKPRPTFPTKEPIAALSAPRPKVQSASLHPTSNGCKSNNSPRHRDSHPQMQSSSLHQTSNGCKSNNSPRHRDSHPPATNGTSQTVQKHLLTHSVPRTASFSSLKSMRSRPTTALSLGMSSMQRSTPMKTASHKTNSGLVDADYMKMYEEANRRRELLRKYILQKKYARFQ